MRAESRPAKREKPADGAVDPTRSARSSASFAIGLDASLWEERTTGISLYARHLASALAQQGADVRLWGAREAGDAPRGEMSRTRFVVTRVPGLLSRGDASLFHAVCNFNLPLWRVGEKRLVLTVHDLIPELLPDTVSRAFRWQFRLWMRRSLTLADQIVCVSERTRADLLARFRVRPERTAVVYHGVDHVDDVPPPDEAERRAIEQLVLPEAFALYAGSLDPRKNVGLLLDALERLAEDGRRVPLVLAGQAWFGSGPLERRIDGMRAGGLDLRHVGYQPERILYELMRRARLLVLPSTYEGFGFPALEAMRLGTPTVASTGGSLAEICRDGAHLISPEDASGLAAALARLWDSPEERRALSEAGRRRTHDFTWRRCAAQTLEVYRQARKA